MSYSKMMLFSDVQHNCTHNSLFVCCLHQKNGKLDIAALMKDQYGNLDGFVMEVTGNNKEGWVSTYNGIVCEWKVVVQAHKALWCILRISKLTTDTSSSQRKTFLQHFTGVHNMLPNDPSCLLLACSHCIAGWPLASPWVAPCVYAPLPHYKTR